MCQLNVSKHTYFLLLFLCLATAILDYNFLEESGHNYSAPDLDQLRRILNTCLLLTVKPPVPFINANYSLVSALTDICLLYLI